MWKTDDIFNGAPAASTSSEKDTLYFFCKDKKLSAAISLSNPISFDTINKQAKIQFYYDGQDTTTQISTEDGKILSFGPQAVAGMQEQAKKTNELSFRLDFGRPALVFDVFESDKAIGKLDCK